MVNVQSLVPLVFTLALLFKEGEGVYMEEDHLGRMVEYIYYSDTTSWNSARQVCLSIGGDLARIDSRETLDQVIAEAFGTTILSSSFWVGLFEVAVDSKTWVYGCNPLSFTENFPDQFKSSEQCYKLRSDNNYVGQRRKCDENNAFLCRRASSDPCVYRTYYSSPLMLVDATTTEEDCKLLCTLDISCQEWFFVPPSTCYLNNGSEVTPQSKLETKFCMKVLLNSSSMTTTDKSQYPNNNCTLPTATVVSSVALTTSTIIPSPTTSIFSTRSLCNCVTSSCDVSFMPSTVFMTSTTVPNCSTSLVQNISSEDVALIAQAISKNLTIDSKTTSAYLRSLVSAEDARPSSFAIGIVGAVCVVVPLGLVLIADTASLIRRCYVDYTKKKQRLEKQKKTSATDPPLPRILTDLMIVEDLDHGIVGEPSLETLLDETLELVPRTNLAGHCTEDKKVDNNTTDNTSTDADKRSIASMDDTTSGYGYGSQTTLDEYLDDMESTDGDTTCNECRSKASENEDTSSIATIVG